MKTCSFCDTQVEDNEIGAIAGDVVACNGCYDNGEPAGDDA